MPICKHKRSKLARRYFAVLVVVGISGCSSISPKTDVDVLAGTVVTSDSEEHLTAARALNQACQLDAEFGRCGCTLDGFQASCEFVQSCLNAGFCVRVTE